MNVVSDVPDCVTVGRAWLRHKLRGKYNYLGITHSGSYVLAKHHRARTPDGICLTGAVWAHVVSRTTTVVDQTDHAAVEDTGVCWLSRSDTSLFDVQLRFTEKAFGAHGGGL